jgi:hypothetical protein
MVSEAEAAAGLHLLQTYIIYRTRAKRARHPVAGAARRPACLLDLLVVVF